MADGDSIYLEEGAMLSVGDCSRASSSCLFISRPSVGRSADLLCQRGRDTHVFGTGWIWRIWRGSNPIDRPSRERRSFVTEMRENDARLSRAHPVPYITFAPLLRRRSAFLPSVRPSFQEKHVYVATATMCFILFSSLSFPRDVPASPSSSASGRLMHDDGR